ncbi:MAG: hypothetical protein ACRYGC_11090 [Janthinobacterium lividum]
MRTSPIWRGVRMRTLHAGADPDSPTRMVTLPAAWDVAAAEAFSVLAPGHRSASLAEAAEAWVRPLARRAARLGEAPGLDVRLHALLLHRRAAPNEAVWASAGDERVEAPGFVLSLPAFHDAAEHGRAARGAEAGGAEAGGFDVAGFGAAVDTVAEALRMIDGAGSWVALSGLDAVLASLGLDYASGAARDVAACLAALLRARVDVVMSDGQRDLLRHEPSWPAAPGACVVPGLAEAARAAREAAGGLPELGAAAVVAPGPADALLGLETGGIAPAFASVTPEGGLTEATQRRLAARALSPEAALALVLRGDTLLTPADVAAHAAMHDAVAPFLPRMPARPEAVSGPLPASSRRRQMPARHSGSVQKATLGGHRLFLRTGEFADGGVGEIEVSLPRESALARGLMDGLNQAVSLGLQHGVPLAAFVEAFAGTQFGPAGAVEGDAAVDFATSPLDYVARSLAAHHLGEALPAPEVEPAPPAAGEPELPLELPRRARLRLVA